MYTKLQRAETVCENNQQSISDLKTDNEMFSKKIKEYDDNISDLRNKSGELGTQNNNLKSDIAMKEGQIAELELKLKRDNSLKFKVDLLKSLRPSLDGFARFKHEYNIKNDRDIENLVEGVDSCIDEFFKGLSKIGIERLSNSGEIRKFIPEQDQKPCKEELDNDTFVEVETPGWKINENDEPVFRTIVKLKREE
jgi:molecular chaperone GrpE (heat shock protein)